ncbi:hypothetical protein EV177_003824 [Coemansia sp. RSA 1804]|nr:hypothetical protein EV177_003824 [Coemansia sp. RSA 1804]
MSTAFFSCQSMVSLTSKKETNCAKVADNALGIENIDDFREAVHIDKSALDIGDLNTLEDEEMFVGSARFEESCLASLAEIESTVSRTRIGTK